MGKNKKLLIVLYLIVLIALLVIIYGIPKLTGALTPTVTLQYGSLQVTDETLGYAVRNEVVYTAAVTGATNYYVPQDTQMRSSAKVMTISPKNIEDTSASTEAKNSSRKKQEKLSPIEQITERLGDSAVATNDYAAKFNGCVSYFADGYEGIFSPDGVMNLSFGDLKSMDFETVNLTRDTAKKGEPIFKICDNSIWYVTAWVDAGSISKYEVGKSVTLKLPLADIAATIENLENEGDKWQVLFKTNRYYEEFSSVREMEMTIVTQEYSGIIIPNASIIAEDGKAGVYVKNKSEEYVFTPIKILISDGSNSIASVSTFTDADGNRVKTVEIYDVIKK